MKETIMFNNVTFFNYEISTRFFLISKAFKSLVGCKKESKLQGHVYISLVLQFTSRKIEFLSVQ